MLYGCAILFLLRLNLGRGHEILMCIKKSLPIFDFVSSSLLLFWNMIWFICIPILEYMHSLLSTSYVNRIYSCL